MTGWARFLAGFLLQDLHVACVRTVYEPVIRNAAGLGVSPSGFDADRYASRFAHTDVLSLAPAPPASPPRSSPAGPAPP